MMSKLATLAFGAAIAISPALVFAQSSSDDMQNSPAMGTNTTGTSNTGASTSGQNGNNINSQNNTASSPTTSGQNNTGTATGSGTMGNPYNGTYSSSSSGTSPSGNSMGTAHRTMPKTAAGWLAMLLEGSSLSGLGLALRRLRKS